MQIFKDHISLQAKLKQLTDQGKKIGFVPTMGALHSGHLSLVRESIKENDISVVSIFVNPTQFNEKEDFLRYPRLNEADISLLEDIQCDILYMPDVDDLYPEGTDKILHIDLGHLDQILEGAKRPGHFDGVVTIVKKLFDVVQPDNAYFGQKDFQQCLVIQRMVDYFNLPVNIVRCPIQREADGLAMSSRNLLLKPEERALAPIIYQTLTEAAEKLKTEPVASVKAWAEAKLQSHSLIRLEYFEIANAENLLPINDLNDCKNAVICTALRIGQIRLIDNIVLN